MKRYDLIPANATKGIAKVFHQGVIDGHSPDGWKNNHITYLMNKLEEKFQDFKNMKDIDSDGLYNIDKVAAYAIMIHDTMATNRHMDDRLIHEVTMPRIALDIDDVVCDFLSGFKERTGLQLNPYWNTNYDLPEALKTLANDEDFWVNLPVKHRPNFEPACYISSRSIPVEFSEKFIQKAGLPCAPVFHVPWNNSKVSVLKDNHIDVLIDDKPQNFIEATKAGVFCYLMDASHNQHFDAKGRRIFNLNLF